MNYDQYNEVINGKETYQEIAKLLLDGKAVGIGWTDEEYTHYDIIFKLGIEKFGDFQRGIKSYDLFVSIIGRTSYGFSTSGVKLGNYIQEKLGITDSTGDKLTELINGIIIELRNSRETFYD